MESVYPRRIASLSVFGLVKIINPNGIPNTSRVNFRATRSNQLPGRFSSPRDSLPVFLTSPLSSRSPPSPPPFLHSRGRETLSRVSAGRKTCMSMANLVRGARVSTRNGTLSRLVLLGSILDS